MIRKPAQVVTGLAILFLFAVILETLWQFQWPKQYPTEPRNTVVASIGTRSITLHEIEQAVALPLYQADQQRSELLQQALQRLIDEELLKTEASRKGVTVSQLVANASQSESIARLADLPAPVKQLNSSKARSNVGNETSFDPQEQARLRQALLVALRRQAAIHINLPPPEAPILSVSTDDDPFMGPADAPITIVEFSDFQCPYCKLSVPIIKEILAKYPGKVRVVYRDYPSPNHPYAPQAAEAAQCAGDQGKFWEYHDGLFERQRPGSGWNFDELAKGIGLDWAIFATCLNGRRYQEEVAKDLRDAITLGVTSTPTFFINGRPLVGAKPFAEFQAVIERLLKQQTPS